MSSEAIGEMVNIEGIGKEFPTPEQFTKQANELKQEVKEKLNQKDRTVNVDADKIASEQKDEPVNIKIKSGGIGSLKNYIVKDTKQHTLAEDNKEKESINSEEEKKLIGEYISDDEYTLIASILVIVIDTVIVNILKFWSGDTRENSFGLTKPKQTQLSGILAQILKKHNVKWSLELLFVFMLVLGYTQSAKNAYEFKKNNKLNPATLPKRLKVEDEDGNVMEVSEDKVKAETRGNKPMRKRFARKHQSKEVEETAMYAAAEEVTG